MKDMYRLFWMAIVGFLVAIIIYPFFHELGHTIACLLVGSEIAEFNLLPLPNVMCNISGLSNVAQIIIGLSGLALPWLLSTVVIRLRWFPACYASIVFCGITLLSMIISIIIVLMRMFSCRVENDDISRVLDIWHGGPIWILGGMLFLALILVKLIIKQRIIKSLITELEHKKQNECTI